MAEHRQRGEVDAANKRARGRCLRVVAVLLVALSAACGSGTESTELEILSWWQKPAEAAALRDLCVLDGVSAASCRSTTPAETHDGSLDLALAKRLFLGTPPTTFDASIGVDLLQWAAVEAESQTYVQGRSFIADLSAPLQSTGIFEHLPDELTDALHFRLASDKRFGVPLNVHRLNVLYYNKRNRDEFKVNHAQRDFLEYATLCPHQWSLEGDPLDTLKIAIDLSPNRFSLALFVFENVLVARDSELYRKLFLGIPLANEEWAGVRDALECVQNLAHHFFRPDEPNEANLDWESRVREVAAGNADFTVTGDWASGELRYSNLLSEVDAVPFPGTDRVFVFTSDTFPLPIGAPDPTAVLGFLKTAASLAGQRYFSERKGSIPARKDVELKSIGVESFDRWRSSARDAWVRSDTKKLMATSGLVPAYFPADELRSLLHSMVQTGINNSTKATRPQDSEDRIQDVMMFLQTNQAFFDMWQRRLAGLADAPVTP